MLLHLIGFVVEVSIHQILSTLQFAVLGTKYLLNALRHSFDLEVPLEETPTLGNTIQKYERYFYNWCCLWMLYAQIVYS